MQKYNVLEDKCVVNNISPQLGSSKQLGCQPYDVYNTMVRNNLFVITVFMNYRAYRKENNIGYFLDTILHYMHTFCIFWIRFYFSHLQHWSPVPRQFAANLHAVLTARCYSHLSINLATFHQLSLRSQPGKSFHL